jgi:hypothetical protein
MPLTPSSNRVTVWFSRWFSPLEVVREASGPVSHDCPLQTGRWTRAAFGSVMPLPRFVGQSVSCPRFSRLSGTASAGGSGPSSSLRPQVPKPASPAGREMRGLFVVFRRIESDLGKLSQFPRGTKADLLHGPKQVLEILFGQLNQSLCI